MAVTVAQVAYDIGLDANKKIKLENSSQYGFYLRIARAVRHARDPPPPPPSALTTVMPVGDLWDGRDRG